MSAILHPFRGLSASPGPRSAGAAENLPIQRVNGPGRRPRDILARDDQSISAQSGWQPVSAIGDRGPSPRHEEASWNFTSRGWSNWFALRPTPHVVPIGLTPMTRAARLFASPLSQEPPASPTLPQHSAGQRAGRMAPLRWGTGAHHGAVSGDDAVQHVRDAFRNRHREEEFILTAKKRPGHVSRGDVPQVAFRTNIPPHNVPPHRVRASAILQDNPGRRRNIER